ncbi:MAG: hypothetical protein WCE38_14070 [Burkholderiales bacterium]
MKREAAKLTATTVFAALAAAASPAQAQESRWQPFISVTPVYEGKADLDNGGDFSQWSMLLRGGVAGDLGGGNRAGVTLNYDYSNYSFSNPAGFGGVAPWGIVQRYGVAVPLSFALRDGWSLGVIPSVDWFKENGASTSDSLAWGGIVSATKRFADGNLIGLGVGVYDRIEKVSALPFLIVDWRFSDRWRLINPLAAGPTGPAGLELDYRLNSDWELGVGAAFRSSRFRLSKTGPVPDGVGVDRGMPVFLRATRGLGAQSQLHLYAGVVAAGELRVENSSGYLLQKTDYDPAPFVAATFVARF